MALHVDEAMALVRDRGLDWEPKAQWIKIPAGATQKMLEVYLQNPNREGEVGGST
jgi:hypothetical protein